MAPKPTPNMDALNAEVTATESVEDAVLIFVDGIKQQLDDAIAKQDPQALADLAASLKVKREAIAAAISAGTGAAGDGTTGSGDGGAATPDAGAAGGTDGGSTGG